ncbi:flagellar basal-body rod protein FlgF [Desulfosarcina ovata]|uniref:Flagellar basal-body rod protein FlgF n=1 Tax=Desulfosarcina ovata subsp. ovata TaxID=2752305 RepID=A0A5K8A896_9BACT|nr:flagellar basal-body rod protein FlgF [Desulfosarcina ovata]BBO88280.1 flagellar basal-body rod protein FlgF [Desulfosarcina ovata subsp. ovata]
MNGGMYLSASGAMVQQLRLEMLANNVANINTIGYKGEKSVFRVSEAASSTVQTLSEDETQPLSPYAPPFEVMIDFSQGALRQTGNALDVAISGSGFFSVQTPDGVQYTRQGSFTLDEDGNLVTPDGYAVLGEGGPINLEEGQVQIDLEGTIFVDGDEVGQLQVTEFADPSVLEKSGNGRFSLTDGAAAGQRPEFVEVNQGYLEAANVNTIQAMTEMIETSRAFEAYQKVIQTADEATSTSINDVGKSV